MTKPQTILSMRERYRTEAVPALIRRFGYSSSMAVPRVGKVVVNVGVGRLRDDKQLEAVRRALELITGQRPAARPARQAIAAFKTRRGLTVGYRVTLRGRRMWDFLLRLVGAAIPRQRDFRGIAAESFDGRGNLTMGFREHIVFPEMIGEDVPFIFGLEVTVVTSAKRREEGLALLKALGFPIQDA